MLKFLLIVGLILYVLYKIGSFFFRAGAASQQLRNQQRNGGAPYQRPNPEPKKDNHYKGGEYIDYEEVK